LFGWCSVSVAALEEYNRVDDQVCDEILKISHARRRLSSACRPVRDEQHGNDVTSVAGAEWMHHGVSRLLVIDDDPDPAAWFSFTD